MQHLWQSSSRALQARGAAGMCPCQMVCWKQSCRGMQHALVMCWQCVCLGLACVCGSRTCTWCRLLHALLCLLM